MSNKIQTIKAAKEAFDETQEGKDVSSGDLRLLTSGLATLCKAHESPVNNIELQAISAMITYVAYNQEVDETTVCEVLTAHYGITEVKTLPARLYQNAIEYLVDLKVINVVN